MNHRTGISRYRYIYCIYLVLTVRPECLTQWMKKHLSISADEEETDQITSSRRIYNWSYHQLRRKDLQLVTGPAQEGEVRDHQAHQQSQTGELSAHWVGNRSSQQKVTRLNIITSYVSTNKKLSTEVSLRVICSMEQRMTTEASFV